MPATLTACHRVARLHWLLHLPPSSLRLFVCADPSTPSRSIGCLWARLLSRVSLLLVLASLSLCLSHWLRVQVCVEWAGVDCVHTKRQHSPAQHVSVRSALDSRSIRRRAQLPPARGRWEGRRRAVARRLSAARFSPPLTRSSHALLPLGAALRHMQLSASQIASVRTKELQDVGTEWICMI